METGVVIGAIFGGVFGFARTFPRRHDPEPPNARWKLPMLVVLTAICVVLAVISSSVISSLFGAVLAASFVVQIGLVLAGRNPWWMQIRWERRRTQLTSAPRSQAANAGERKRVGRS